MEFLAKVHSRVVRVAKGDHRVASTTGPTSPRRWFRQRLEQHREAAPGFGPRQSHDARTVLGAVGPAAVHRSVLMSATLRRYGCARISARWRKNDVSTVAVGLQPEQPKCLQRDVVGRENELRLITDEPNRRTPSADVNRLWYLWYFVPLTNPSPLSAVSVSAATCQPARCRTGSARPIHQKGGIDMPTKLELEDRISELEGENQTLPRQTGLYPRHRRRQRRLGR